jgi:hypothetical protein
MRFCRYSVAVVCDIKEMYLQIRIPARDRSFFRFLWRNLELQRRPDVYEFERIVFGDASAPFRAQFVSQENAEIHKEEFPLAAETVKKSTYMDDSLDSVKTEETAIELYRQLIGLWGKAGMQPRKWLSNSPAVLKVIPKEHRAAEVDLDRHSLPATKTLGLLWLASFDLFSFRVTDQSITTRLTKRTILSKVATIFDPLGFLSPFIIRAKIILQELWSKGLSWDDEIDAEIYSRITTWFVELEFIPNITVPRCLQDSCNAKSVMILTFVDASNDAYGAVSYLRIVRDDESVRVTIIASKTRVTPLAPTSTPRLELLAAVLGLRLATSITTSLGMPLSNVRFWSDSMNVLYWIRGKGRQFRPFVANRIGEIQSLTDPEQWQYIHTKENPADLCSRGVSVKELSQSELWWQGPTFLKLNELEWPRRKIEEGNEVAVERKTTSVSFQTTIVSIGTTWKLNPTNWSNWKQLSHVLAWVLRFVNNVRTDCEKRQVGSLTPEEVEEAERDLIRDAQRKMFRDEYAAIRDNKPLATKNRLSKLMPRIDDDGLLRCDGRLCYAEFLPYDVRFPIILPRGSWITKLIVKHYHEQGKHITGTNHTLANLSTKFWIIAAREEIREWENECNGCKRRRAKAASQVMAPLSKTRFSPPFQAFSRVSIDYGGPFVTIQGRGRKRQKRWLCLFTCLLSRAVHLEMAFGLDTDSFLRCLTRMASRRGYPKEIVSDRGTNFVGADRELRELVSQLEKTKIQEQTVDKGIKWHFNPPLAPHFGGAHEIMIKAAKKAIYNILSNADVNDEELMTAFIGAESLLNSRPLTYQTSNPKDVSPLTPNHFLHGQSGGQSAPESVDSTECDLRQRWRRIQELISHFWRRWMKEWLPMLNGRSKWTTTKRDLEIGDVVLAISPEQPRGHWPLGRIIDVFPGKDNHVRVAKVQVGNGTLVRPIAKLAPVEIQ